MARVRVRAMAPLAAVTPYYRCAGLAIPTNGEWEERELSDEQLEELQGAAPNVQLDTGEEHPPAAAEPPADAAVDHPPRRPRRG